MTPGIARPLVPFPAREGTRVEVGGAIPPSADAVAPPAPSEGEAAEPRRWD
jgi:hypothetical protein